MYLLLIYLHVASALAFMLAHGATVAISFALPHERDVNRIRALLDLSARTVDWTLWTGLALLATGVAAGFMGRWWGSAWIWVSLILLIGITIGMSLTASKEFAGIRRAAGLPYNIMGKPQPAEPPQSTADILTLVGQVNPWRIALWALGGTAVILALMVFKPF